MQVEKSHPRYQEDRDEAVDDGALALPFPFEIALAVGVGALQSATESLGAIKGRDVRDRPASELAAEYGVEWLADVTRLLSLPLSCIVLSSCCDLRDEAVAGLSGDDGMGPAECLRGDVGLLPLAAETGGIGTGGGMTVEGRLGGVVGDSICAMLGYDSFEGSAGASYSSVLRSSSRARLLHQRQANMNTRTPKILQTIPSAIDSPRFVPGVVEGLGFGGSSVGTGVVLVVPDVVVDEDVVDEPVGRRSCGSGTV